MLFEPVSPQAVKPGIHLFDSFHVTDRDALVKMLAN